MANVNNTNVYIGKSENKPEYSESVPLKYLDEAKLVNDKKIVSIDIASIILRKYEQNVLQISCLNFQHFLFFFSLFAIHIR